MALIKLNNQSLTAVTSAGLPSGTVLQVVSATKTDKQDTANTTPQDITGLSVAITPSSTSSKMLVRCDINCGGYNNTYTAFFVKRDAADMLVSTAVAGSSQIKSTFTHSFQDVSSQEYKMSGVSHSYLDSPATTSEITYKVQFASMSGGVTATINAPSNNTDAAFIIGGTSTITVSEIAG